MPIQYPLLLPYEEDGWYINISYSMSSGSSKSKVSMREAIVTDCNKDMRNERHSYYLENSSINLLLMMHLHVLNITELHI